MTGAGPLSTRRTACTGAASWTWAGTARAGYGRGPGYRNQVGLLRDVRRVLAAGQGTGDRGSWCHRQARYDQALGWLGSDHLRRASLHTYVGDGAPGQANGNELNLNGGLWHEVTASSR